MLDNMEQRFNELDARLRTDHDLLIRLDSKLDAVNTNLVLLQTGLDGRLKSVEADVAQSKQWIHDFQIRYRFLLALASGVGGFVGFVLALITQVGDLI